MSAAKRILTESAHALSQAQKEAASSASATYVPDALQTQLQNVGRKVRQSVSRGYATNLGLPLTGASLPSTSTTTQDDISVPYFRSDVDTMRQVFSSRANELPRFCDSGSAPTFGRVDRSRLDEATVKRKRAANDKGEEGTDQEGEEEEGGDTGTEGDPPMETDRIIRPPPLRKGLGSRVGGLRATHSLPASSFAFSGSKPSAPPGAPVSRLPMVFPSTTLNPELVLVEGQELDFAEFIDNPVEF